MYVPIKNESYFDILQMHKDKLSIHEISKIYNDKYSQKDIATVIAQSEITKSMDVFLVIPSKINYEFKIVNDY